MTPRAVTPESVERERLASWLSPVAVCGYTVLIAGIAWWTWRAFRDSHPFDTGLAYQAGQLAWATGHPERLSTWNGAPLLAVGFGVLTRLFSVASTAHLVTLVNAVTATGAIALVLSRMRTLVPRTAWWVLALATVSYAPLMSVVWWKQFSLVALVLAIGGYELLRRERLHLGAFAIALSVSIKPVAFLLPVALLLRRDTRRAAVLTLAWIVALDIASQAVLAWRAHDLATLDPTIAIRNFAHKTTPVGDVFMCHPINFAPSSLLCRAVGGPEAWTLQRVAVYLGVALLAWWVLDAVRTRGALSWELCAFACALSLLPGPIEWAHYEIMLAPLFVLLAVRFAQDGAAPSSWAGLGLALALASLLWDPYGTLVGAVHGALGAGRESPTQHNVIDGIAQFAQYVLILTGVIWYGTRHRLRARSGPSRQDQRGPRDRAEPVRLPGR